MTCIYWRRSTLNMHWEHFAMWAGIRWRLKRKWYNHLCKTIFSTPPVQSHKDGVVIFSMIGTEVMTPYLVAAKSLHHHLKRGRSEEHTSELQSLMSNSYAVFCLKKKNIKHYKLNQCIIQEYTKQTCHN